MTDACATRDHDNPTPGSFMRRKPVHPVRCVSLLIIFLLMISFKTQSQNAVERPTSDKPMSHGFDPDLFSTNPVVRNEAAQRWGAAIAADNSMRSNMPQEKALELLVSTNRSERLNAVLSLDDKRDVLIQKLLAILKSTNADSEKVYAVVVLGRYRSSEAVPILVQHLAWDAAGTSPGGSMTARFEISALSSPVSIALWDIGSPAVPALLEKIAETDDRNMTRKCVGLCRSIEGLEVTQFRLQGLLQTTTDQKKKGRIQAALDFLPKPSPPIHADVNDQGLR